MSRSRKPPSYLKHKACNLARVVIDGRTEYLGRYGSKESYHKHERLLSEWPKEPGRRRRRATSVLPHTVAELLALLYFHAEKHYRHEDGSPKRELQSFRYVLRPLEVLFGGDDLDSFGPRRPEEISQGS